jgi:hypothetical protein
MTNGTLLLKQCSACHRIRAGRQSQARRGGEHQQRQTIGNPFSLHEMLTAVRYRAKYNAIGFRIVAKAVLSTVSMWQRWAAPFSICE